MSSILSVDAQPYRDNTIIGKQWHSYTPFTTSYANDDEIRIAIQSQDLFVLPSESYLLIDIEGVAKTGATAQMEAHFVHNFLAFMFSEIRYELNGIEIDRTKNVGIASTMKTLAATRLSDKAITAVLQDAAYKKLEPGKTSYLIPLRYLLGFADDYNKVVMNAKHELILIRSRTNTNALCSMHDCYYFKMTKIQWKMPHITLADNAKLKMLRYLERQRSINVNFRAWDMYELPAIPQTSRHIWSVKTTSQANKPRYVIVGLQTGRGSNIKADSSRFDHCKITDVKLFLNTACYPYDNMKLNFENDDYHEIIMQFYEIQKRYYNGSEAYNPTEVSYKSFKERCLFAFDCTRTEDSLVNSAVDVRIEISASENIKENTAAYCLIITDRMIEYSPFNGIVTKLL